MGKAGASSACPEHSRPVRCGVSSPRVLIAWLMLQSSETCTAVGWCAAQHYKLRAWQGTPRVLRPINLRTGEAAVVHQVSFEILLCKMKHVRQEHAHRWNVLRAGMPAPHFCLLARREGCRPPGAPHARPLPERDQIKKIPLGEPWGTAPACTPMPSRPAPARQGLQSNWNIQHILFKAMMTAGVT